MVPRYIAGLVVFLLVLTSGGAHATPVHPVFHGKVDVGGYKLYINCTGRGTPTVVLDAHYAGVSSEWDAVQPPVSRFARVCSYDRAGLGNSDPRKKTPGTGDLMVKELYTLLHRAHIPGPYVLAGHSLGGMNARLYAYQHRSEVAGIVEVDAAVEGLCSSGFSCPSGGEDVDLIASGSQLRSATHGVTMGSLGDLPLVVLSNGLGYWGNPNGSAIDARDNRLWQSFQLRLPRASTNSVHVIALHSDHDIPTAQPGLVTQAIREVEVAVRSRSHKLPPCGRAFTTLGGRCVRP